MQPRKCSRMWTVTNTPRLSANTPPLGICGGSWPRETAWVIVSRAKRSKAWRSSSERDGILSLFAGFEHAQLAALLDAIVEMTPELEEILGGGNQSADNDEPQEQEGEAFQ